MSEKPDLFREELDQLSDQEIEARLAAAVWVDDKRAAVLRRRRRPVSWRQRGGRSKGPNSAWSGPIEKQHSPSHLFFTQRPPDASIS